MASNEEEKIEPATIPRETPEADSSITETTPLVVKTSAVRRSGLLGRLRENVLIKSKAANMILFWSAMMYLLYGILLNPDNLFTMNIMNVTITIVMESGIYAFIAIWLLFYPLAGYLADIRYGRYKLVIFGIGFTWTAIIIVLIAGLIGAVTSPISVVVPLDTTLGLFLFIAAIGFLSALGLVAFLMMLIGFSAFAANVIQFGIDQLQDLPARDSFLFIH